MLDILYQDSHLVAINKPSGLLVHRSSLAGDRDTCMTLLRDQLDQWVYPVHRLDRGTSGVLLFALDRETARIVSEAFATRAVHKSYIAVVRGYAPESGDIDYPLAEEPGAEPVPARSLFKRMATIELPYPVGGYPTARYSLLEIEPVTGRRHQIRRHLAHIRHPIVGDIVHGEGRHNRLFRDKFDVRRLLLHANTLRLTNPYSESESINIKAPLSEELLELFDRFDWSDALSNCVG